MEARDSTDPRPVRSKGHSNQSHASPGGDHVTGQPAQTAIKRPARAGNNTRDKVPSRSSGLRLTRATKRITEPPAARVTKRGCASSRTKRF